MRIYILICLFPLLYRIKCLTEIFTKMNGDITIKNNIKSYLWIFNTSCSNCKIVLKLQKFRLNNNFICFGNSINFSSLDFCFDQNNSFTKYGALNDDGFYFGVYYAFKAINLSVIITYNIFSKKTISDKPDYFQQRNLYSIARVDNNIYVHGGKSLNKLKFNFIMYSKDQWSEVKFSGDKIPPCFYGHSMMYRSADQSLMLIGGRDCYTTTVQYSCYWIFSLVTKQWNQIYHSQIKPRFYALSFLYKSIVIVSLMGLTNNWKIYPYVQFIYNNDSQVYRYPGKRLAYVCGYLDDVNNEIVIHGGIDHNFRISSNIWSFSLLTRTWKLLSNQSPALYFHQCLFVNRNQLLLVNGFNNTSTNQNTYLIKLKQSKTFTSYQSLESINSISSKLLFWNLSKQLNYFDMKGVRKYKEWSTFNWQEMTTYSYFPESNYPKFMKMSRNCDQYSTCSTCTAAYCIWCSLHSQCVSVLKHITVQFIMPTCHLSTDSMIGSGIGPIGSQYEYECAVDCSLLPQCNSCAAANGNHSRDNNLGCAWCELKTVHKARTERGILSSSIDQQQQLYGRGKCISILQYPALLTNHSPVVCEPRFSLSILDFQCPLCDCNGHSVCVKENVSMENGISKIIGKCKECMHNTTGKNCEKCRPGYRFVYDNSTNQIRPNCQVCGCVRNNRASDCFSDDSCEGLCYENGRIGKYCNKCDERKHFVKFLDKCVIKSKANFRYVVNKTMNKLSPYVTRMHFFLTDLEGWFLISDNQKFPNITFIVNCTGTPNAKITVEAYTKEFKKSVLYKPQSCVNFRGFVPIEKVANSSLLFSIIDIHNLNHTFQLSIKFEIYLSRILPQLLYLIIIPILLSFVYSCIKNKQIYLRDRDARYRFALENKCKIATVQLMSNYYNVKLTNSAVNKSLAFLMMEPIKIEKSEDNNVDESNNCSTDQTVLGSYLFTYPTQDSNSVNLMIGSLLTQIPSNHNEDANNDPIKHLLKLPLAQISSSTHWPSKPPTNQHPNTSNTPHVSTTTHYNAATNPIPGGGHDEVIMTTLLDRDDFDTSISPSGLLEETVEITVQPSSSIGDRIVSQMNTASKLECDNDEDTTPRAYLSLDKHRDFLLL